MGSHLHKKQPKRLRSDFININHWKTFRVDSNYRFRCGGRSADRVVVLGDGN